jgi:hypothetical protein
LFTIGKENAEDVKITGYRKMTTNASGTSVNVGGKLFLSNSLIINDLTLNQKITSLRAQVAEGLPGMTTVILGLGLRSMQVVF